MEKRRFTKNELGRCSGKDGTPTYIAYEGGVYDVSRSFLWQEGEHQAIHAAGSDLTRSFDEAPPDASALDRFPMVGTLEGDWAGVTLICSVPVPSGLSSPFLTPSCGP